MTSFEDLVNRLKKQHWPTAKRTRRYHKRPSRRLLLQESLGIDKSQKYLIDGLEHKDVTILLYMILVLIQWVLAWDVPIEYLVNGLEDKMLP